MKTIITIAVLAAFLTAGSVMAGDGRDSKDGNLEKCQSNSEVKQARICLGQLNSLIDKWHEANLDGNEKKIHQYEQAIINMLVKDINVSFHAAEKAEREANRSALQVQGDGKVDAVLDDERGQVSERVLLAGKQSVLYKLRESDSFSLKYRALTNYQELLCRQLGMTRLELAEDIHRSRYESR